MFQTSQKGEVRNSTKERSLRLPRSLKPGLNMFGNVWNSKKLTWQNCFRLWASCEASEHLITSSVAMRDEITRALKWVMSCVTFWRTNTNNSNSRFKPKNDPFLASSEAQKSAKKVAQAQFSLFPYCSLLISGSQAKKSLLWPFSVYVVGRTFSGQLQLVSNFVRIKKARKALQRA